MKLRSTYLRDNTLFPLERTSINSLKINLKNQIHNSTEQQTTLAEIDALERKLTQHFHNKIKLQPELTRQLVSFQANKPRPTYRWYQSKVRIPLSKLRSTRRAVFGPAFAAHGPVSCAAGTVT